MKKRYLILLVLVFIVLFALKDNILHKITTAAIVDVLQVNQDFIEIQKKDGEIVTIRVPNNLEQEINADKEYFVVYESYMNLTPKLISIEP